MNERTILPPEVSNLPPTDPLPEWLEMVIGRIIDGNLPEAPETHPTQKQ